MAIPLRPGALLAGRFLLEEAIGKGGMSEVWGAVDQPSGLKVAIKVLTPEASGDPIILSRFAREASIVQRIVAPNVCRTFGAGSADGRSFLVTERLFGEALDVRIKRQRSLPVAEVSWIGRDILAGLAAAHALGVVHRDLKPANVFLEKAEAGERAKVLDFGIAKALASGEQLTTGPGILGTVAYMAPEQVGAAKHVDLRADFYAFGTLVVRALTGRLPFGSSPAAAIEKTIRDAPSLEALSGRPWPRPLEAFVARCLDRRPAARYGSANEVATAFAHAIAAPLGSPVGPKEDDFEDDLPTETIAPRRGRG